MALVLPQLVARRKTEIQIQHIKKKDRKLYRTSLDFSSEFRNSNTFLLLFDKSSTEPKVSYLMLDHHSKHPGLMPKCSTAHMPRIKGIYNYRIIVVNNQLYLLGGRHAISGSYLSLVYRYDVTGNMWVRRASMHKARSRFAVAEKDGCIYVFGEFLCIDYSVNL